MINEITYYNYDTGEWELLENTVEELEDMIHVEYIIDGEVKSGTINQSRLYIIEEFADEIISVKNL